MEIEFLKKNSIAITVILIIYAALGLCVVNLYIITLLPVNNLGGAIKTLRNLSSQEANE